jgi:hypothetical protein
MTLNEKQALFTRLQAEFQCWCFENGYPIIEAESFRPPFMAEEYARRGKGIKNSVHTKKLARDLFRVVDGRVTWDSEAYAPLGEKWKSMHPLNRWGGDFRNRDRVHYSMEHNGVM